MPSLFQRELEIFQAHHEDWRSNQGRFVAIQGEEIVNGFFDSYPEALRAGLKAFGAGRNFLVKQVGVVEPVYLVS